jgi:hypothetical protein
MKRYSSAIAMFVVGVIFMAFHFYLGWGAYVEESASHNQIADWANYMQLWGRDTTENLQSEFMQLAAQFALLAGMFETWRIKAYEKDQEEVKRKLDTIMERLARSEDK